MKARPPDARFVVLVNKVDAGSEAHVAELAEAIGDAAQVVQIAFDGGLDVEH